MTDKRTSVPIAHVRLCIELGRHTTLESFLIEQDMRFKESFTLHLCRLTGVEPTDKPRSCLPVVIPPSYFGAPDSPGIVPMVLGEFNHHAAEQAWIAAINAALDKLKPKDNITLSVTEETGDGGWCSPNPDTNLWEKFRTYDLCMKYSNSGDCFPANLQDVAADYRNKFTAPAWAAFANDLGLTEAQLTDALGQLAGHQIMAVLSVVEREPTT